MKVIFRTDASIQIGSGHVMRCLTLADALHKRGAKCHFICRDHAGNMNDLIRARGFSLEVLRCTDSGKKCKSRAHESPVHNGWLGAEWRDDAEQTRQALAGITVDWLIVDHYALDICWEHQIRGICRRLMVIDDLANRTHDCDLLLDQNFSDDAGRYSMLVPDGTRILLGPRYAVLRPEYQRSQVERNKVQAIRRVLVFFGGSDPDDMTRMTLEALGEPQFSSLEVDVVVGANYRYIAPLESLVEARPRTYLHHSQPHLADLMCTADIAIGAGGITTWERLCTGLPSIVISLADNQRPACQALSQLGAINYVGHYEKATAADLIDVLTFYMGEPQVLARMSALGRRIVDGFGASRISETLMPHTPTELTLRPAKMADIGLYFDWANDPEVRKQAFNIDDVNWDTHSKWYTKKLAASQSHLFVMQAGELPVGQIRFDEREGKIHIDYSIDTAFRGRGWGRLIVELGIIAMRRANSLFVAEVKATNTRSAAVFSKLGFLESHNVERSIRQFLFDSGSQRFEGGVDRCA